MRSVSFGMVVALSASTAPAQAPLDVFERAQPIIASYADAICVNVDQRSLRRTGELSGEAKAEVRGLVRSLLDVGVDISGQLERVETEGVLQQDLAQAIAREQDCRRAVYDDLIERIAPDPSARPSAAAPGPQSGLETWVTFGGFFALEPLRDVVIGPADYRRREIEYEIILEKQTPTPLENCDIEEHPDGWRGHEAIERQSGFDVRFREGYFPSRSFETPGRTRILAEVVLVIPYGDRDGRPLTVEMPREIRGQLFLDCANFTSTPLVINFPIP